jgi:molecular chaperone Hsp33
MSLRVECEGPFSGLSVETNAAGDVRGYLFKNPISLEPADLDDPSLAALWGAGNLTMTRFPEGATTPFTGRVSLEEGSLALNLARYYLRSEQKPTAFVLSTKFDREGYLLGAGALFLQPLPGADEGVLAEIEERLSSLPSLGAAFSEGTLPEAYLDANFGKYFPRVLDSRRVEFFCPCSLERFAGFIGALPLGDLEDLAANGPFPVRATCHYCNSTYEFSEEDMRGMLKKRIEAE